MGEYDKILTKCLITLIDTQVIYKHIGNLKFASFTNRFFFLKIQRKSCVDVIRTNMVDL